MPNSNPLSNVVISTIVGDDLFDRFAELDVEELRAWMGRLEDAEDFVRALLKEKLRQRRMQRRREVANA
jgi:hypothetical protein